MPIPIGKILPSSTKNLFKRMNCLSTSSSQKSLELHLNAQIIGNNYFDNWVYTTTMNDTERWRKLPEITLTACGGPTRPSSRPPSARKIVAIFEVFLCCAPSAAADGQAVRRLHITSPGDSSRHFAVIRYY